MIELTLDVVKRLSGEAIAERGEDYVYVNPNNETGEVGECLYVHRFDGDGNPVHYANAELDTRRVPGCHVGDVLMRAGIDPEWFDGEGIEDSSAGEILHRLAKEGLISMDYGSVLYLETFQSKQDHGDTWGESRQIALRRVEGSR